MVKDIDLYRLLRAADAHLGVGSTVLTEAVLIGTPNLISVVDRHADLLGYVEAGVAKPVRSADDVLAALADPRPPDPDARAAFLARHFGPGDASGRIADGPTYTHDRSSTFSPASGCTPRAAGTARASRGAG